MKILWFILDAIVFFGTLAFLVLLLYQNAHADASLPKGFTLQVDPPKSVFKTDFIGTPEITIQPPFAIARVSACGAYIKLTGPATTFKEDNDVFLNVLADEIAKACKEFYK